MRARMQKISKYKPSIFQGSLKFETARSGFSLITQHPLERTIFRALIAVLFILICAYFYFVSASILNVIARKEALSEIVSLRSTVSLLERDYYALSANITPSAGMRLGLSPVSETSYVHRPGTVGVAQVRTNEI